METVEVRANGKWMQSMRLLFPGYIFLLLGPDTFYAAKQSRRMWSLFTPDGGGQKFLREDLQRIILASKVVQLEAVRLEEFNPGRRVRIVRGHPLAGMEAVVDLRKHNRVYLQPKVGGGLLLGAAAFTIDASLLELI